MLTGRLFPWEEKKPIRIVQTNKAYYPVIGGIETVVANLAEGLNKRGDVSVEVVVCNDRRSFRTTHEIINDVPVTYAATFSKIASLPISLAYARALGAVKGDILHIHEPFPLADLAVISRPSIRKNFSKIVVSWHSDIIRQKRVMGLYTPFLERFLEGVDKIVVATPHHITTSSFIRKHESKCQVIPYGIKFDGVDSNTDADLVKSIRDKYGSPLVLFVGRLVYYKGLPYLIEAMKRLDLAHLLIVGSGPLENELRSKIARDDLSGKISIISHVPEKDLFAYYKACDVFALPSTEASEAFGIVQVEAMACGKPVVSTNLDTGVTYINRNEITGITVPARDAQALADALRRIITDPILTSTMGKNAKARVMSEFTVDAMVTTMYEMYRKLLLR